MNRAELERRPLLILCLALILGLTIVRNPANLVFLLPIPWLLRDGRSRAVATAGFCLGALLAPGQPPPLLVTRQFVDSEWTVVSLPKLKPYGQRCEIQRGDARLSLIYTGPLSLCPGSKVAIKGVAKPPGEGMDDYFRSRSLVGRITCDALQVTKPGPWMQQLGCAWRDRFLQLAKESLGEKDAALMGALAFNADGLLSDETVQQMRATGTTHLIAASGLQVLIIAQGLFWLLTWLPIPRSVQVFAVAAVLLLYAVATGMNPPVMRAVMMSLLANTAWLFRREPDWPSALAASALIYLLWKPTTVFDVGFQLSFLAVLFLNLLCRRQPEPDGLQEKWGARILAATQATLIASLVLGPLLAYQFGYIAPLSVLSNVIVVCAIAPTIWVAMASVPCAAISTTLATLSLKSASPLLLYLSSVLGAYGWVVDVPQFSGYWLVPFYLLVIGLGRPRFRAF